MATTLIAPLLLRVILPAQAERSDTLPVEPVEIIEEALGEKF